MLRGLGDEPAQFSYDSGPPTADVIASTRLRLEGAKPPTLAEASDGHRDGVVYDANLDDRIVESLDALRGPRSHGAR